MKGIIGHSCLIFLGAVLQFAGLFYFLPPPFRPNLPLTFCLLASWQRGFLSACWFGFWSGWLEAAIAGGKVGGFLFSRLITALLLARLREEIYAENAVIQSLAVFLGTGIAEGIFYLWNPIRGQWDWTAVPGEMTANALLAFFLSFLFRRRGRLRG